MIGHSIMISESVESFVDKSYVTNISMCHSCLIKDCSLVSQRDVVTSRRRDPSIDCVRLSGLCHVFSQHECWQQAPVYDGAFPSNFGVPANR